MALFMGNGPQRKILTPSPGAGKCALMRSLDMNPEAPVHPFGGLFSIYCTDKVGAAFATHAVASKHALMKYET